MSEPRKWTIYIEGIHGDAHVYSFGDYVKPPYEYSEYVNVIEYSYYNQLEAELAEEKGWRSAYHDCMDAFNKLMKEIASLRQELSEKDAALSKIKDELELFKFAKNELRVRNADDVAFTVLQKWRGK